MASNSMLTPGSMKKHGKPHKSSRPSKHEKGGKKHIDTTPHDDAYDRNFTRGGTPKLSASSKAMGQRR